MKKLLCIAAFLSLAVAASAQTTEAAAPRRLTLREAVDMAMMHNHVIRIAESAVTEKREAKQVARSSYFPVIHNESTFLHVTDSQFIGFPAGALGVINGTPIPSSPLILNQGGKSFTTSGTTLVQPLTQLLRVRAGNDVARAELSATQSKALDARNEVALKVRQLYYKVLVAESRRDAISAHIHATDELQTERVQQVKYGSTLQTDLIESRAQSLQSKQELLSNDVQLANLRMQFNDAVGLPIDAHVTLDPQVQPVSEARPREDCVKQALQANPEIAEAHAGVEKAEAAVRLAKREYIPDFEAFAHYGYSNNVPFLARNSGGFGVRFGYDLFDGGKKHYALKEREAQLAEATENLARVSEEIEVRVQAAYNNLDRASQMIAVSQELLSLRKEASRISVQQLDNGALLRSQAESAAAQELEAQTALLQSQLDFAQAQDELNRAIGATQP